jgi:hypothetical protein
LIIGSLSRATDIFSGLGKIIFEPVGGLVSRKLFYGRGSGALAIVGASGEFRKGVL